MRAASVLLIVAIALALGVLAGISESRLATRVLVIGVIPAMWGVAHVLQRVTGRDMWQFGAPYPWTEAREDSQMPPPLSIPKPMECPPAIEDRSTAPRAA